MSRAFKMYLGDSVYVELDPYRRIALTTNNGYPDDPRNKIVLEPEVLSAFIRWLEATKLKLEEEPARS